ncbi:hypothetical protein O460_02652, partial [Staphylococcus aureus M0341]
PQYIVSQKRDTTAFYDITLKLLKTLRMSGFARPIIFE